MIIRIAGIDPALKNIGIARMTLDLDTLQFEVEDLILIKTEKQTTKQVRQNSDDLRRCREAYEKFQAAVTGCHVAFGEVPTGAQSARAAFSFGSATMLLASCPVPLIEVQPFETKLATVGTRTASKDEMIDWAVEQFPNAPWLRYDKNGKGFKKGDPKLENEHLADGVAIPFAGIRTQQFKQLMAIWKASAKAA